MELIKSGYIQLIGSDAHNNKIRNFCLKPAYKKIEDLFGYEIIEKLKYPSWDRVFVLYDAVQIGISLKSAI